MVLMLLRSGDESVASEDGGVDNEDVVDEVVVMLGFCLWGW